MGVQVRCLYCERLFLVVSANTKVIDESRSRKLEMECPHCGGINRTCSLLDSKSGPDKDDCLRQEFINFCKDHLPDAKAGGDSRLYGPNIFGPVFIPPERCKTSEELMAGAVPSDSFQQAEKAMPESGPQPNDEDFERPPYH